MGNDFVSGRVKLRHHLPSCALTSVLDVDLEYDPEVVGHWREGATTLRSAETSG